MISVVIPILNEANNIGKLVPHLLENASAKNISEIIIVDGGSTDGSQNVISQYVSGRAELEPREGFTAPSENIDSTIIKLIGSKNKGRARQMNTGARAATGTILYFLHADSFPPKNFDQFIINEVKKGNEAGCFRMQFDSSHWWLRLAGWLTQFRWRACRGGDQSQFITRELFDDIGGFDESYVIYEDNILINELFTRKQFVVINKKIKTSARLYRKHGIWKLQYHYWMIYLKKWLGADAEALLLYYKTHIG